MHPCLINEAVSFEDRESAARPVDVYAILDQEGQESLPDHWLDIDFSDLDS